MSQKDNKILFLLMPNDFNDTEFLEPYNLLLNEGYKVDVAGISGRGVAIGSQGHEHHPNKCISKMSMHDVSAAVCTHQENSFALLYKQLSYVQYLFSASALAAGPRRCRRRRTCSLGLGLRGRLGARSAWLDLVI